MGLTLDIRTKNVIFWDTPNMPETLKSALLTAKKDKRLTYGVMNSAQLMETQPDTVMCCILPANNTGDVTTHIHTTLIEAFCWENDVRLIKVDSSEKLEKILADPKDRKDFTCVTIEYPQFDLSDDEDMLLTLYQEVCDGVDPHPIIPLPV